MANGVFGIVTYYVCQSVIELNIAGYLDFIWKAAVLLIVVSILITALNALVYRKEFLLIKGKLLKVFVK